MRHALPRRAAFAAIFALALGLRLLWPLADPPARLSWSNGVFTDPAAAVHAARNAALTGQWEREGGRELIFYPLLNVLSWLAFRLLGPGRLACQILSALFGTAAVVGLAALVGRARGERASLWAALLGGTCFWLAMFSRIPVAENLAAALVAASATTALSRGRGANFCAGLLGGAAMFFAKLHAGLFVVALLVFLLLKERRPSAWVPAVAGLGLALALWVGIVLIPFRGEVLDQLRSGMLVHEASSGSAGWTLPLLGAVRTSWLFHRMPILALVGGFFVFRTLGEGERFQRALSDGSALLILWFMSTWVGLSLLPYQAPRYFVLAALPLTGAAACQVREISSAGRQSLCPSGRGGGVGLGFFVFAACYVALDALAHYSSWAGEFLRAHQELRASALAPHLLSAAARLAAAPRSLGVAAGSAVGAVLVGFLVARGTAPRSGQRERSARRSGSPEAGSRLLVRSVVALFLMVNLAQFAAWAVHRSYAVEEAKASIDALLGEGAILFGPFAPLMVQDSSRRAVPWFGSPREGVGEGIEATHVLLGRPADAQRFDRHFPGLRARLVPVRGWPLRTRHVWALDVFRVPRELRLGEAKEYVPSAFERAAEALRAGRAREALEILEKLAAGGGEGLPDVLALRSECAFRLGEVAGARALMERAVALRPHNPESHFHLGELLEYEGDTERAREEFRRALRLDPYDENLARRLGQLRD